MAYRTETMQLPWPHGPHAERSKRAISPEFVNGNSFCSVYSTSEHVPATHARSQIEEQLGAGRQKKFLDSERQRLDRDTWLSRHSEYEQQLQSDSGSLDVQCPSILTVVYNARDNWQATSDTVLDRAKNRGSSGDANSRTSDHIGQFVTPAQIVDALLMMWKLVGDTV